MVCSKNGVRTYMRICISLSIHTFTAYYSFLVLSPLCIVFRAYGNRAVCYSVFFTHAFSLIIIAYLFTLLPLLPIPFSIRMAFSLLHLNHLSLIVLHSFFTNIWISLSLCTCESIDKETSRSIMCQNSYSSRPVHFLKILIFTNLQFPFWSTSSNV